MIRKIIALMLLVSVSVFAGNGVHRYMRAYGRDSIEIRGWNPEFSKEDHCIFMKIFFNSTYRDEKRKMEEEGFHTDASSDDGERLMPLNILRIDPDNVEWIKVYIWGRITNLFTYELIMELCY